MKEKLKPLIICSIVTVCQSLMYLLAKLSPFNTNMIGSIIDDKIPFVSWFIFFYVKTTF